LIHKKKASLLNKKKKHRKRISERNREGEGEKA